MKEWPLKLGAFKVSSAELPVLGIVLLTAVAYVLHAVFSLTLFSWLVWAVAAAFIIWAKLHRTTHLGLIVVGIALLLATPISTHISWEHFFTMTGGMMLAVIVPYLISRRYFKDSLIHFNLDWRRKWSRLEIGYVVFAVIACALWLALYFATTDAHKNWPMATPGDITIVFVCIMVIGIWEEFFFIGTVYGVLQRLLPNVWAMVLQAVFFSAFLFQVGFKGWIVPFLFMYALFQSYVFYKTKTLLITLVIHVLVDLIVFISLYLAAYNIL